MAPYYISSDVLFEILSWVELKTMTKCRLVSRECNRLTYESTFMRFHCQRTKTVTGYFIQSLKTNKYYSCFLSIDNPGIELTLDFLSKRSVNILAVVQGLVFCMSENQYYICKPSTRQCQIIPNPNPRGFTKNIGMVVLRSDPLRFKIVRLSEVDQFEDSELDSNHEVYDHKRYQTEIFDSESWTWRQLDDLLLSYFEFLISKPAISACGGLHWLTCNGEKNNILSFYQDKESWKLVSPSDSVCMGEQWHCVNLAEYEGKLALICVRADINFVEVWVMKDCYGEKVWRKRHSVNLTALNEEFGHSSVFSFYNADTLLMMGINTAIFYNFKSGRFHRLKLQSKVDHPQSAFFVQTDCEPVQLYMTTDKTLCCS